MRMGVLRPVLMLLGIGAVLLAAHALLPLVLAGLSPFDAAALGVTLMLALICAGTAADVDWFSPGGTDDAGGDGGSGDGGGD